jgi:hypothetical protein
MGADFCALGNREFKVGLTELAVGTCVGVSVCVCVCVYLSVCLFIALSVRLFIALSVRRSVYLSVRLFIALSVRRSVCLSVCGYDGVRVHVFHGPSFPHLFTRFRVTRVRRALQECRFLCCRFACASVS